MCYSESCHMQLMQNPEYWKSQRGLVSMWHTLRSASHTHPSSQQSYMTTALQGVQQVTISRAARLHPDATVHSVACASTVHVLSALTGALALVH